MIDETKGIASDGGVYIGFMYDEILETYKGALTTGKKPSDSEIDKSIQVSQDLKNRGVNYSLFSCYLLLGFQDFYLNNHLPLVSRVITLESKVITLESKVSNMEIIINKLVDKLAYLSR